MIQSLKPSRPRLRRAAEVHGWQNAWQASLLSGNLWSVWHCVHTTPVISYWHEHKHYYKRFDISFSEDNNSLPHYTKKSILDGGTVRIFICYHFVQPSRLLASAESFIKMSHNSPCLKTFRSLSLQLCSPFLQCCFSMTYLSLTLYYVATHFLFTYFLQDTKSLGQY